MDPVILIFGGLAAFFIFKLFSVLGDSSDGPGTNSEGNDDFETLRNALTGNSSKNAKRKSEATEDNVVELHPSGNTNTDPAPEPVRAISPAGKTLLGADESFDEKAFLDGAKYAYEMIVEAFADNDISSVRAYLSENVRLAFEGAIEQRKLNNHKQELTFIGVDSSTLSEAKVNDDQFIAVTDFTSNQVRVTRDAEDNIIDGDPNRVDLVRDRWTFARKRGSDDPNWVLVATGSA